MVFHGWKKEIPNFLLKKKTPPKLREIEHGMLEECRYCIYIYIARGGIVIHIYTHTVNLHVNVEVELGKMLDIDRDKERNR